MDYYYKAYHDPLDEPTADPLDPSFFDFDYGEPLGKEALKGPFMRFPWVGGLC